MKSFLLAIFAISIFTSAMPALAGGGGSRSNNEYVCAAGNTIIIVRYVDMSGWYYTDGMESIGGDRNRYDDGSTLDEAKLQFTRSRDGFVFPCLKTN